MDKITERDLCSYPIGVPKKQILMAPKRFIFTYRGHAKHPERSSVTNFSMIDNIPYSHLIMYQDYILQIWNSIYNDELAYDDIFFEEYRNIAMEPLLFYFFARIIDMNDGEYKEILIKASQSRGYSPLIIETFAEAGVLSEERLLMNLRRDAFHPLKIPAYTQKIVAEHLSVETLLREMELLSIYAFDVLRARGEEIASLIKMQATDFKDMPTDWVLRLNDLDNLKNKRWDELSWLKNIL